jgi:hypothetical protein
LALEELRINARHETLEQLLNDTLEQPDAKQLFLNKFLLDTVYGRPDMSDMAARFMALLGAARAGLSEIELADLLALPNDPIASDTGKPRLPQIHLSRLINNFAPFLINKEGRRAPMHRIFGEVALHHFGAGIIRKNIYIYCEPSYGKGKKGNRSSLSNYPASQVNIHRSKKIKGATYRGFKLSWYATKYWK